jgi:hypothetical protein
MDLHGLEQTFYFYNIVMAFVTVGVQIDRDNLISITVQNFISSSERCLSI